MRWISAFEQKPRHVFVVHGEDEVAAAFAARLESELGLEANAPYNGESWDLISLTRLSEGNRERLRRPSREAAALDALPSPQAARARRAGAQDPPTLPPPTASWCWRAKSSPPSSAACRAGAQSNRAAWPGRSTCS